VLQGVAGCCRVLQGVVMHDYDKMNLFKHVLQVCCSGCRCVAVCCRVLQCVAQSCVAGVLQCVAVCCRVL